LFLIVNFLNIVVTEVVLFSIIAFKTLTFHKRHTWGAVRSLVRVLLQIFTGFWQWKSLKIGQYLMKL